MGRDPTLHTFVCVRFFFNLQRLVSDEAQTEKDSQFIKDVLILFQ